MKPSLSSRLDSSSTARSGSATLWTIGVVAILGLVVVVWRGLFASVEGGSIDFDRIVTVEARDVLDAVTATGRVEPIARVAVMSRASGIIEALHADEGDVVRAGQVLVVLDREQLQAQLEQDEADLLAAQARLTAARARLEEARVRVLDPEPEFLEREARRMQELHAGGDVSVRERDEAARLYANAAFRVRMVEASLPILEADVVEAEAQLAATRAARERSATALRETTILCPVDGVVLLRDKEVGDGVSSILTAGGNATQIMELGDLSEMHIEARVDEVDLGRIRVGLPALITVDAYRGAILEGRVDRIAPAGSIDDNGIVTFQVELSVQDPDGILRPDMTADAKLVIARRDGVASLPQVALERRSDGSWVARRVEGVGEAMRVVEVGVQLGLSDGLMTEILDGLAVGDRVLLAESRRGR